MPEQNPSYDIVVVGSNMIDMITRISRLPKMGETLAGSSFSMGFGGKGANQAVTAARLGARVAMVCKVGKDTFGSMVRANFKENGVTARVFEDDTLASGVAPITVDDEGRNLVIIVPGANMTLSVAEVEQASDLIKNAKILICQLEIPDEAILKAFEIARANAVRIIFNPAPARKVPPQMIEMADIVVPNETEAELLTGLSVNGIHGASDAARRLKELGAQTVIVTLGADGALLWDGRQEQHFSPPKVNAVDTTGSGDAFIGSLAFALMQSKDMPEAIRFANRVAALSVTKAGTQTSFPTMSEVDRFVAGL
ncbi:MAG: ribokinase [Chloroflexi bacterium]|nr:ribokinase [Chloroflexota bacterium]